MFVLHKYNFFISVQKSQYRTLNSLRNDCGLAHIVHRTLSASVLHTPNLLPDLGFQCETLVLLVRSF
jgi:hypothetical protein